MRLAGAKHTSFGYVLKGGGGGARSQREVHMGHPFVPLLSSRVFSDDEIFLVFEILL